MEYNKMIEMVRQSGTDAPGTDEVLRQVHHRLNVRRRRHTTIASITCLLLAATPLAFTFNTGNTSPTLAETVSATVRPAPGELPAPLAGYRNSLRNHQTMTII